MPPRRRLKIQGPEGETLSLPSIPHSLLPPSPHLQLLHTINYFVMTRHTVKKLCSCPLFWNILPWSSASILPPPWSVSWPPQAGFSPYSQSPPRPLLVFKLSSLFNSEKSSSCFLAVSPKKKTPCVALQFVLSWIISLLPLISIALHLMLLPPNSDFIVETRNLQPSMSNLNRLGRQWILLVSKRIGKWSEVIHYGSF